MLYVDKKEGEVLTNFFIYFFKNLEVTYTTLKKVNIGDFLKVGSMI